MILLAFMGAHPFLTFFLVWIMAWALVSIVQYLRGIPDPPPRCPKCGSDWQDE